MTSLVLWGRFKSRLFFDRKSGFALETSRLNYEEGYLERMEPKMSAALEAMAQLEAGAIANRDEGRMVGHYWLRNPERAPTAEIRSEIVSTVNAIQKFASSVHAGVIRSSKGARFTHILVVGIGGSALGPQFANQALASAHDPMKISFFDNTDPDGMAHVLYALPSLDTTLVVVISKSGGTKETRNGQLVAKAAFEAAGLDFRGHFVAVTGVDSELDKTAVAEGWLARFPMWDWVGGRTSECSAVGLLPFALQGFNVDALLEGAAAMDELTRNPRVNRNPAALMALGWFHCGCGKGLKDMVILPYKDRLELFSRYLQQLVMESLGKEHDLEGNVVNQGLAVYGNKGSTDQHAYVQQLRDGLNNFFAVFIEVLKDASPRTRASEGLLDLRPDEIEVEQSWRVGDYLTGFYLGTRQALYEKNRESITVTIPEVSEFYVGMLIALFERAVGLYASMVNVNAYHQPGVEAGKKAAASVLVLQAQIEACLARANEPLSSDAITEAIGAVGMNESVFKILRHLGANGRVRIEARDTIFEDLYGRTQGG